MPGQCFAIGFLSASLVTQPLCIGKTPGACQTFYPVVALYACSGFLTVWINFYQQTLVGYWCTSVALALLYFTSLCIRDLGMLFAYDQTTPSHVTWPRSPQHIGFGLLVVNPILVGC